MMGGMPPGMDPSMMMPPVPSQDPLVQVQGELQALNELIIKIGQSLEQTRYLVTAIVQGLKIEVDMNKVIETGAEFADTGAEINQEAAEAAVAQAQQAMAPPPDPAAQGAAPAAPAAPETKTAGQLLEADGTAGDDDSHILLNAAIQTLLNRKDV
jgi:hypothetical protein